MSKKDTNVDVFDPRLAAVYRQREDKLDHYDEWAATYETDLVDDLDYVAHFEASDIFARLVGDRSSRVLDVACGTGLVGAYLAGLGYAQIDGVDFSGEMLRRAGERQVYRHLWQHDFTQAAKIEEAYDALICVGLFSFASPEISDMHHVVECVAPGGSCVITVNGAAWRQLELEAEVHAAAAAHGFVIEDILEAGYIRAQDIDARVLVIRR